MRVFFELKKEWTTTREGYFIYVRMYKDPNTFSEENVKYDRIFIILTDGVNHYFFDDTLRNGLIIQKKNSRETEIEGIKNIKKSLIEKIKNPDKNDTYKYFVKENADERKFELTISLKIQGINGHQTIAKFELERNDLNVAKKNEENLDKRRVFKELLYMSKKRLKEKEKTDKFKKRERDFQQIEDRVNNYTENAEAELCSKFVLVLNSKKQKCQRQIDEIKRLKSENQELKRMVEKLKEKHLSDDEDSHEEKESSEEEDSDDEIEGENQKMRKIKKSHSRNPPLSQQQQQRRRRGRPSQEKSLPRRKKKEEVKQKMKDEDEDEDEEFDVSDLI